MNRIKKFLAIAGTSTVLLTLVPLSMAFGEPNGGANVCGVYTAAPSPSTSQNSNHVDGSVGNADDKCPPGQEPGGNDNNSGYECDANNGVGDGNPAHTVNCPSATPTQTVSPTPSASVTVTPSATPSPTVSPTVVPTETVSPSPVATQSVSPTPVVTETVSPTPTVTPVVTVSPTAPETPVATETPKATETPVVIVTTEPPVTPTETMIPHDVVPVRPLPFTGSPVPVETLMVWSMIGIFAGGTMLFLGLRKS